MKIKSGLILGSLKNLPYLLMGLMMNTLMPMEASAGDHIQITHEILIESGAADNGVIRGVVPSVVVQTHEGGYIVAGKSGWPWAGRIDATGHVQWRYMNSTPNLRQGEYSGAAVQSDDSVILSAHVKVENENKSKSFVLLTHIDKTGGVISEKLIAPNDGKGYGIVDFQLVAVEDGAMLFGFVYPIGRPVANGKSTNWIVALNAKGEVKWEKLLTKAIGRAVSARVLPNHEILLTTVVYGLDNQAGRRISRMAPDATIKEQSLVPFPVIEAVPVSVDSLVHLVSYGEDAAYVITLDEQMKTAGKKDGDAKLIQSNRIYYMPDHSLVLFGKQTRRDGAITPSMAWISSDLNRKETLVIQPELASLEIVDAIPSGRSGEFVCVRGVRPQTSLLGRNETRHGAILSFVQVK